jgi:hypothetical protein
MANKLYEEESIRAIANEIRYFEPRLVNNAFTVAEMPRAIESVADYHYEKGEYEGRNKGLAEGAEKLKTEEAKTIDDVAINFNAENITVTAIVPSGYYADNVAKEIDADPIYDRGIDDGVNNVKIGEARTNADILVDVQASRINVPSGYYANTEDIDASLIWDNGYEVGYDKGLNEGGGGSNVDPTTVWQIIDKPDVSTLSNSSSTAIEVSFTSNGIDFNGMYGDSSSGLYYRKADGSTQNVYAPKMGIWVNSAYKTITVHEQNEDLFAWLEVNAELISGSIGGDESNNTEIEEMLLATDENYDDEGKQFYSVYKWLDVWHSNFSSSPVTYSAMNRHPTLWLHLYIAVELLIDGYSSISNYRLDIPPDEGDDSIEVDEGYSVRSIYIEGVRWSEDGV